MVKITHTTISAALLSSSSEDIRADSEDSDDRVMTSGSDADDDDTLNTSSLSSSLASYENSASDEICSTKITLSSDDSIAQIVREKTVQNLQQFDESIAQIIKRKNSSKLATMSSKYYTTKYDGHNIIQ